MNFDSESLIKVLAELKMDEDNHECFTFNQDLRMMLQLATIEYNIKAGEQPVKGFKTLLTKYCNEIKQNAEWHKEFCKKYGYNNKTR